MRLPPNPATEAFLRLVDTVDAEANVVTHAVVRAQATMQSMLKDLHVLLGRGDADHRVWAEAGLRLMQHRATLVEALAALPVLDSAGRVSGPCPVDALGIPVPPVPTRRHVPPSALRREPERDRDRDHAWKPLPALTPIAGVAAPMAVAVPQPPQPRHLLPAIPQPRRG